MSSLGKKLKLSKLCFQKDKSNLATSQVLETKPRHKACKSHGVSYSRVRRVFKQYISEITDNPGCYRLHTFQSGGGSAATSNSVSWYINFYTRLEIRKSAKRVKRSDISNLLKRTWVQNFIPVSWHFFKYYGEKASYKVWCRCD